jgi:hypothetical protein
MARFNKCDCHKRVRDEDSLMLTNHHPECKLFNPASELKGVEEQAMHFFNKIQELKNKIKDMQNIIDSV